MKRLVVLIPFLFLVGCASVSVPVKPKFPDAITQLMEDCPDLQLVPNGTEKLSETISIVSKNYGEYHKCRAKINSWKEWYSEQKNIYESVK